MRRLAPLIAALALSGCGFFTGTEKATQTDQIGKLHFAATFCATDGDPTTGDATTAPDGTNTEPGAACSQTGTATGSLENAQALIAIRIPAGLTPPDELVLSGSNTFAKSPDYTSSLTTAQPPPAGYKWQGYISAVQPASTRGAYTTAFDIALPPPAAGQPFAGPVKARVIAGYRTLGINGTGAAAVSCADANTTCISSTQPTLDFTYPTRDLAVGTPAAGSLAFPLRFAGKTGPSFALTASTTVPAGSAVPTHATFVPTDDQQTTETVNVTVPPGTDPGTYDVTLTAETGAETRSGKGTITVAAPTVTASPSPAPVKTGTPTPSPTPRPVIPVIPTAAPAATPKPTPKVGPKRFTLTVKRTGARAFKARGRLSLPSGVARVDGCAGIVKLTVGKTKKTTIVTGSCTFSRTLKVKKAGSYKVTARFTGNQALAAKGAKSRRFKAS